MVDGLALRGRRSQRERGPNRSREFHADCVVLVHEAELTCQFVRIIAVAE
jgi:hypothetical protein